MNTYCDRLAIDIKQGVFNYGNTNVLNDLNMTIEIGKITALLGPTGAGKTTVIRLILGRIALISGSVEVFGQTPGTSHTDIPGPGVGYMPQKMALFEEFSIAENLSYYGLIYHMKSSDIEKWTQELTELFQLPDESRKICGLIGSERRRVSIAVTLLHRPKLVILDESTAGVDPLLRRDIWHHLREISRDGKTVLITTHYIEEARSASSVAFMNYGKILSQGDPDELLAGFETTSPEQVFFLLCQANSEIKPVQMAKLNNSPSLSIEKFKAQYQEESKKSFFNSYRFRALLTKNIRQTTRAILLLGQVFLIPFVAVLMMLCMGHSPRNNPIAVYNANSESNLSTLFLGCLDKNYFRINEFSSNESAFDSVVKGENRLSLVIPKDFGDNFEMRIKEPLEITDEELAGSELKVSLDGADVAFSLGAHEHIVRAMMKFFGIAGKELVGYDLSGLFNMIKIEENLCGDMTFNFARVAMPLSLMENVILISMISSMHQIMHDKGSTSLERTLVAGVTKLEYMLAQLTTSMIISLLPIIETVFFIYYVYPDEINLDPASSIMTTFGLMVMVTLMGWSIGYLIGSVSSQYLFSFVLTFGVFIASTTMSGTLWPLESLPVVVYYLSFLVPPTLPSIAMQSILFKGWTLAAPAVQYGFLSSLLSFVVFLVAAQLITG